MATTYFYVLLAIVVGVSIGLQAVINSQLNKSVDIFLTALVVNLVATITAIVIYLIFSRASFASLREAESWTFLGGILGVVIVMGSAYLIPRVGVAVASGIIVSSQLLFGLLADHFGFLGIETMPLNWFKVAGLGLMMLGVALFFSFRA